MNTIIAALDLEPHTNLVVEKALLMARKFDAALHLIHVVAPVGTYAATNMMDPLSGMEMAMLPDESDLVKAQTNMAEQQLGKIVAAITYGKLSTQVLWGTVETAIINYAQEKKAGLIVIGTHQRSGLARLLNGETSVRILHEAQIPILVIPTVADHH